MLDVSSQEVLCIDKESREKRTGLCDADNAAVAVIVDPIGSIKAAPIHVD